MKIVFFTKQTFFLFVLAVCFLVTPFYQARADVAGRWSCHFNLSGSGDYPQDFLLYVNGSTLTGQELQSGTDTPFANLTGTASGSSFTMTANYISGSYYSIITGSVSGSSMTGNWHNDYQTGTFSCAQIGVPSPTLTPTSVPTAEPPSNNTGIRPTAINLFCNRIGVGLSTSHCSVTVGDAGAPPRITPSGLVNFAASSGFFPSASSCSLQQTPYSPGVAACNADFSVPAGFPIGIAFPIDATYVGDSVFAFATTSHATIQAGCVGDAEHPCSGAVALTFADLPQILKNAISTVFQCGSTSVQKSFDIRFGSAVQSIAKCVGNIVADAPLGDILGKLDLASLKSLSQGINGRDASTDSLLRAIRGLADAKYQTQLDSAVFDSEKLNDLVNKIMRDQSNDATHLRAKKTIILTVGTADIAVKANSQKAVKITLTKTATKFVKALKLVGKGDVNVKISMKGQRSTAPKKPFNKSFIVTVGLS